VRNAEPIGQGVQCPAMKIRRRRDGRSARFADQMRERLDRWRTHHQSGACLLERAIARCHGLPDKDGSRRTDQETDGVSFRCRRPRDDETERRVFPAPARPGDFQDLSGIEDAGALISMMARSSIMLQSEA
jgi:hypothetical protein